MKQYQQRVSGPLLDRIDLQVSVPRLNDSERDELLQQQAPATLDSTSIRSTVITCRERQLARAGCCNARLGHQQVREYCSLAPCEAKLLADAIKKMRLSVRAAFRILKIARTVADLSDANRIEPVHLLEAINYRRLDTLR